MKKIFTVNGIAPFDLFRLGKDGFYKYLDNFYERKFGKEIEILEAELTFIKDGIKIKIITYLDKD